MDQLRSRFEHLFLFFSFVQDAEQDSPKLAKYRVIAGLVAPTMQNYIRGIDPKEAARACFRKDPLVADESASMMGFVTGTKAHDEMSKV